VKDERSPKGTGATEGDRSVVAILGGLGLLLSTFLPWYRLTIADRTWEFSWLTAAAVGEAGQSWVFYTLGMVSAAAAGILISVLVLNGHRVGLLGFTAFLATVIPVLLMQASLARSPCQPDPCSGNPLFGWFTAILSSLFPMWAGYSRERAGWLSNPLTKSKDADPKARVEGVVELVDVASSLDGEERKAAAQRILDLMGDEALDVRLAAIGSVPGITEGLSLTMTDRFARRLLELAAAENPATRAQAAITLGTLAWEERLSPEDAQRTLSRLVELIDDPEGVVRDAISVALALLEDQVPDSFRERVNAFLETREP